MNALMRLQKVGKVSTSLLKWEGPGFLGFLRQKYGKIVGDTVSTLSTSLENNE